jgi:hypothetical protein
MGPSFHHTIISSKITDPILRGSDSMFPKEADPKGGSYCPFSTSYILELHPPLKKAMLNFPTPDPETWTQEELRRWLNNVSTHNLFTM